MRAFVTPFARLTALTWGDPAHPTILLLHGFPDTPHTFAALGPRLAAAGRYVVAPFMPGYAPSEPPVVRGRVALDQRAVVDTLAALIAQRGGPVDVVGHDWGAVATYLLGALHPAHVRRAVAASVPPPAAFFRGMSARQAFRSRYMGLFQLGGLAERRARASDFAYIRQLWRRWSPGWAFSESDFAPVRACLSHQGALEHALGYYRAVVPALATDGDARRAAWAPITHPTLVVTGASDGCVGPEVFATVAACGPGVRPLAVLDNAGHFLHREQPARFESLVRAHLELPTSPTSP